MHKYFFVNRPIFRTNVKKLYSQLYFVLDSLFSFRWWKKIEEFEKIRGIIINNNNWLCCALMSVVHWSLKELSETFYMSQTRSYIIKVKNKNSRARGNFYYKYEIFFYFSFANCKKNGNYSFILFMNHWRFSSSSFSLVFFSFVSENVFENWKLIMKQVIINFCLWKFLSFWIFFVYSLVFKNRNKENS